jgi:hypothetical protein
VAGAFTLAAIAIPKALMATRTHIIGALDGDRSHDSDQLLGPHLVKPRRVAAGTGHFPQSPSKTLDPRWCAAERAAISVASMSKRPVLCSPVKITSNSAAISCVTSAIAALDNQIGPIQTRLNSPDTPAEQVDPLREALIDLQARRSALQSTLIDLQSASGS